MIPTDLNEAYGHETLKQRLMKGRSIAHVRVDLTPCWEWTGGRYPEGYGYLDLPLPIRRRYRVHRLAAALWLPDFDLDSSLFICHVCDNPACFRPEHLRPGTCEENVHDAMRKGRLVVPPPRYGSENCNAKLSEFEVVAIRKAYALGETTHADLAAQYRLSLTTVSRIVRGEAWAAAAGPITRHGRLGEDNVKARLTDAAVADIRRMAAAGEAPVSVLAARFNVSDATIRRILTGQTWRHVLPSSAIHEPAAA